MLNAGTKLKSLTISRARRKCCTAPSCVEAQLGAAKTKRRSFRKRSCGNFFTLCALNNFLIRRFNLMENFGHSELHMILLFQLNFLF